jgi:hypothetical protein
LLTNKFARRFVMVPAVIIRAAHLYLADSGADDEEFLPRAAAPEPRRFTMRKTILAILGSALLAASLTHAAAAAEHHKAHHKAVRAPAAASEQFRNSNDYYVPQYRNSNDYYAPAYGPTTTLPQPSRSEIQRYENGARSAPAGY